ncbi:MAG: PAS domain-containing sensor histidine kinase, partial [Deltaproteobacteria bacterium]|nr:PAS domain-containing sensor histidine kinase [Deltaproteobacteria bacterium]
MEKKPTGPPGDPGIEEGFGDISFYHFVVRSLPIAVVTVNPQRIITSFNPWAEALTGYSEKEALGRYCGEVLQGGMCKHHCPLKSAIDRSRPVVRTESTIQNSAGETIPVRMHTAALLNREGGLIGAVEAFQDLSHLKAMERERDNLISMFGHDMKSSLSIIGGFARRLRKKGADLNEEKQFEYLEIIQMEVRRLESLIGDFLEFARLQAGKLKLKFQDADLDKELMELCKAYQPRTMESGIRLQLKNEISLPRIQADPDRLRRVFRNLLDNAFKFSTRGTTITITTQETNQDVIISIEDEGKGINPDDLPFIFDIFRRGKNAGGDPGQGIGLATVKAIVEG